MTEDDRALSEFQDIVDSSVSIIALVQGKTRQGRDFWAYVAIPPSKFQAFKAAEAAGNYRLDDWGRILQHGFARQPPHWVREEMKTAYGARDSFEADIDTLAKQERGPRSGDTPR